MDERKRTVQRQFSRRAGAYARSASHARDADLDLLVERLRLTSDDRVLDVATGTGFTAFAVRPHVQRVVGLDLTIGMLVEARRLEPAGAGPVPMREIGACGSTGVPSHWYGAGTAWVAGDVEALPFADGAFSVVTVRRAPHHFPRVERAVTEMLRVLAPGGRLGIIDQVTPEEEPGLRLMEDLEVLRDASHVRALTLAAWRDLARRLGVEEVVTAMIDRRLTVEEWLELAGADERKRQAVSARLARASDNARERIGYRAEPPSFLKRWIVLVGRKGGPGRRYEREA